MKLIIAGGRDYTLSEEDYNRLEEIEWMVSEVVSGNAAGADRCGEEWAKSKDIPVTLFKANWHQLGKKAGFVRNAEMAEYADMLMAFPGGRGTDNMVKQAKRFGLKIFDHRGKVKKDPWAMALDFG